ncbi:VOC family protein [Pseudonocardia parietis]|uniref:Catechol 2,3-dioxygenase-like lactoylglutathione lyase family enzyme n=1 Tax=Pseudonocardia parietis TaxID=570936 RepID=A0ABS4VNQ3_9PSEU|nr:VOC family protein [Pseudonocardia parietis]MBP2365557.1 catechol 2,3-dioxygenase-like lactoylglutathione lyase family enzyme [Pseudonocardia parietis]
MSELEGSMIDHLNLPVGDLARAVAFYTEALAPLGIHTVMEVPADPGSGQKAMHAFGAGPKPFFWVIEAGHDVRHDTDTHLAFTAPDRETVDAFWAAALAAGATPLRPPGLCPEYHSDYYGAFAGDPDGINVEAVCHRAPHPPR